MKTRLDWEELFMLVLQGKATEEDKQQLQQWLESDSANRETYVDWCTAYYQVNYVNDWQAIDEEEALQRIHARIRPKRRIVLRRSLIYAVAAVCLLLIGGIYYFAFLRSHSSDLEDSADFRRHYAGVLLKLNNGEEIALEGEKEEIQLPAFRLVDAGDGVFSYDITDTVASMDQYNTLVVPRGGIYSMILSDNSRVWLNADSEIRFPLLFDKEKREIFVSGEIFLEVAKDSDRPFIVHTAGASVYVTGTSFNVMAYPEEGSTEITLISGAVQVEMGAEQKRKREPLLPGEQLKIDTENATYEKLQVNPASSMAWKDGLFDFEEMRLEELCLRLSRWYDMDFIFVDDMAREKLFTGAVKRDNPVQFMLDFVEKTSGVRFVVQENRIEVYNQ